MYFVFAQNILQVVLTLCLLLLRHELGAVPAPVLLRLFPDSVYTNWIINKIIGNPVPRGDVQLPPGFGPMCAPPLPPGGLHDQPPPSNIDVCFILQVSCHISSDQISNARNIMAEIADRLSEEAYIGAVTYSGRANVRIPLGTNSRQSGSNIARAIRKMSNTLDNCQQCKARTHEALRACNEQFKSNGRDDTFYPNLIVIFTDGVSFETKFDFETPRLQTVKQAEINKKAGIITLVGSFKNPEGAYTGTMEWLNILAPSSIEGMRGLRHPFEVMSDDPQFSRFNIDRDIVDDIVNDIFTSVPICSTPCSQFADVVLVLDRSDSIRVEDLDKTLNFFREFIGKSIVHWKSGLQFGILTYNSGVYIHSQLREHTTIIELQRVIDRIPRTTAKFTQTDKAINEAIRQHILRGRLDARMIVIIATDGRSWHTGSPFPTSKDTIAAANQAKLRGIDVFVVGLPNYLELNTGYRTEWRFVASKPVECSVINMQSPNVTYDDLYIVGIMLTNELCKPSLDSSNCIFRGT